MEDRKHITISQYAALKGISKQAVYKRLNNKLKDFLIVVDGQKYLDIAVLSEAEKNRLNEVEQQVERQFNNQIQPQIEFLESQMEEKDKTIAALLEQIKSLQKQNENLTDIIKGNQVLLAAEKQLKIEAAEDKPKEKKGIFGIFRKRQKETY